MFSFFKKKKIVAHLKLSGVIGNAGKFKQGIDFAGQEELIKKAFSLKKGACVAISINSPGGSPVQSHLIYSFIRQQAKKHKKKVIVFAEDVAASGGYLISCAGDEIYANSSSIIGSIGVIYSSFGFTELIKKIGVERRVHTAGKNKSTLDPFLEEKNEDIERLKNIQLDLHKDFIDVVEKSRGSKLNKSDVELFSGEFWSGSKAKNLGLIDGIGNAHEILKEKFGEDVIIKKFEKSKGWLSQKLSSSSNQVEVLQLQHKGEVDMLEETYLKIISAKTAELFAAATKVGAILSDAENKEKEALEFYGRNLGLTFQIADDTLDYNSELKLFGKKIGKDFYEGKITLPIILLFQKANLKEKESLKSIFLKDERDEDDFNHTLSLIKQYEIIKECYQKANHYINLASNSLSIFKDCNERNILENLTSFSLSRDF